jgi:hypothetical protein
VRGTSLARRAGPAQALARIDNGLGIENSEQGKAVTVCTGLVQPWSEIWPALRTIS